MTLDPAIEKAMLGMLPDLRQFAFSLCRSRDRADDLVQETLTRAIAAVGSFKRGTNLGAWLFTILRNTFTTEYRRSRRSVQDVDGRHAGLLTVLPDQDGWCIAEDLCAGLRRVPNPYRQALVLVGVSGLAYDEAAMVARCQSGTMKSRVSRARTMLAAALAGDPRSREPSASDRISTCAPPLLKHRRQSGLRRPGVLEFTARPRAGSTGNEARMTPPRSNLIKGRKARNGSCLHSGAEIG